MWGRDLTIRKWSEINGFSYNTVRAVLSGTRGKWNTGKAKRIREALISQGFAETSDFNEVSQ